MVAQCPEGWEARGDEDQCYLVHAHGTPRTFTDARIYCQARGGDLAHIETIAERDWLGQLVGATGNVGMSAYMWVGGKKVDGDWKWVETDQPIDNLVLPWEGTGSGDCAALTLNSKLIKQDCSQKLKFICHRDIDLPMVCDYTNGWEDAKDRCYKKSSGVDSWHDAEVECMMDGGHLMCIDGDAEQQLAYDLALTEHDKVWIGLTEENHAGEFTWVDGTIRNTTYWHAGQPDTSFHGYGAALVDNDDPSGGWVVEKVTTEYHYLCEKETGSCLPGWMEFEGSCYFFNEAAADLVVWMDARATCEAVKAHMVVLDTWQEDLFFRTNMKESEALWIGLYNTDGVTKISTWVPTDCATPRLYACEAGVGDQLQLIKPPNERYCPDGWEPEGDYCYFFSSSEKSWVAARKECTNQHATSDLVSILTWGENDFVRSNQKAKGWLGLNKMDGDHGWLWSDGSDRTITNWENGEPSGNENCVELYTQNGKWNDLSCSDLKAFSCKMPASTIPIGTLTTTTPRPDTSACGYDWRENPTTGECYRIEVVQMTFQDARLHCQNLYYSDGQSQPDVVSIASVAEQIFLQSIIAAHPESFSILWIGMTNDQVASQWVDGTPLVYYNFKDDEPSSYVSNQCVELYTDTGEWSSGACFTYKFPFICEKKVLCPDGWSSWNLNCYRLSSVAANWFTAEDNCHAMLSSELVSITNKDENDYIEGLLIDAQVGNTWLGLRDDDSGKDWHWSDGSLYDWTNWGTDEPNDAYDEEHCGEMRANDYYYNGQWNDIKCSTEDYYVCKIKSNGVSVGMCLRVVTSGGWAVQNTRGQVKCQQQNSKANLINIHSEEENRFFMDQLKQSSQSCWVGLQYDGANWTWADGTPMEYDNWNYGEPNNLEAELCAEMIDYPNGEPNGKWNNLHCGESRAFGCEVYPTHAIGCEDGWEAFGDYCYWFSDLAPNNEDYLTHEMAQAQCQGKGANLAAVHTAEENDFLFSKISYEYYYVSVFIGLTDVGHHLVFEWVDGSPVVFTAMSYLTYLDLQSSTLCGSIEVTTREGWTLQDCTYPSPYVCKKPAEPQPLHPEDTLCDQGDLYYEGSCYNTPQVSTSWEDAKKDCENRGQHLLALEDQFETAYFSSVVGETGLRVWLGLSGTQNIDGSVTFAWINGGQLDYTYWDKYEPGEYDRVGYTTPSPPTTKAPSDYCIYGWEHKLQRCYKVMQDAAIWGDAEEKCIKFGGHLVSVESEMEQTLILALSGMTEIVDKYGMVWVGLEMTQGAGYEWTDGSGFDFVNWAEGQPESHDGRETCVSADATTLKTSDSVCLTHLPFVCEAPTGSMMTTASPPTKPPLTPCGDNAAWYEYEGHCYKFISSTDQPGETWWRAHVLCREEGGELASIASDKENYWIESVIYAKEGRAMWLGGRAKLGTGYEWLDGEPFIIPGTNGKHQEDCIAMYTNQQGYWNDQNCGSTAGRICKRTSGVTQPPAKTTKAPDGHCPEGWLHTAYLTAALVGVKQHMWIGMRYVGAFNWVDQTDVTYVNWDTGEPNGGAVKEECVEVDPVTGLWNDNSCSGVFGAVCMMTQDPKLPDHHTLDKCPSPHDNYLAYDGACYRVVKAPQTWEDAEAACTLEDAHLVSVMTISEDSFVWAVGQNNLFGSLWMGLDNQKQVETFTWSDGWPTIYTHWGENEPVVTPVGHRCVVLNVTDGSWYTKPCNRTFASLCKYTNETAPTPDPPVTGYCPDDRWKDLKGGYCYLFSNVTETWNEANKM
ncbi:Macrophage mannose receptor 1 [Chionoecetes opilio]|uniref:Macrophage mannose receptor 1 n=1 Tax=Chionoecetes opilio TaxID=41210 RepID=A0A8J8WCT4_CHIOP|nr:Macrophage mannose receptor 1 [Chionoecetes opilio]